MQLTLKGKVSLYTAKGKFQFIVDSLYPIDMVLFMIILKN